MPLTFTLNPTFRDIEGRFASAEDALLQARRDEIRDEARRFVDLAQDEAPGDSFPDTIRYRTFVEGDAIGFTTSMAQPLGTFIEEGTRPHTIAARNAGALSFFWPTVGMRAVVPKGGGFSTHVSGDVLWIGKGFVNHPGTKANRFMGRAYRRWIPGARVALRRMALRYTRTLSTGSKSGAL